MMSRRLIPVLVLVVVAALGFGGLRIQADRTKAELNDAPGIAAWPLGTGVESTMGAEGRGMVRASPADSATPASLVGPSSIPRAPRGGLSPREREAEVLYSQPANAAYAFFSAPNCFPYMGQCGTGQQSVADNFALARPRILQKVRFWGGYFAAPAGDQFTIRVLGDAGGVPGTLVHGETGMPVTRQLTGASMFGFPEWRYEATLATPATLDPGVNYWIEIYDLNAGSPWGWETGTGPGDNGRVALQAPGVNWGPLSPWSDMAFELLGIVPPRDCNSNGVNDTTDITVGTSSDCQPNEVPDECEVPPLGTGPDCQPDGTPDECQLAGQDCNSDGTPDACQLTANDCDANGVPDECDTDCNSNGRPDACDIAGGSSLDCQANGTPDECDLASAASPDCNANSVPDECDVTGYSPDVPPPDLAELNAAAWAVWAEGGEAQVLDDTGFKQVGLGSIRVETNGGFDNYALYPADQSAQWNLQNIAFLRIWFYAINNNIGFQESSPWIRLGNAESYFEWRPGWDILNDARDQWVEFMIPVGGNAIWTRSQVGTPALSDVHYIEIHADTWDAGFTLWMDGIRFEPPPSGSPDCNSNGIPDECDVDAGTSGDCNTDGTPDECQLQRDCNSNGVQDICDLAWGTSGDCNANLVPDVCDLSSGTSTDCNNNGTIDECDISSGVSQDCQPNGTIDECDISGSFSLDCQPNGTPDECETAAWDCNGNGTPDDCDVTGSTSADCNGSGIPDECELDWGSSLDCNGNGTPDECDLGATGPSIPPVDMAEMNAAAWSVWADGGQATLSDDQSHKRVGQASVRLETDGGFDNYARYPGNQQARWDLSGVESIRIWFYAVNPNLGFQEYSPRVRLGNENGYYEWRPAWDILNDARDQWVELIIPIDTGLYEVVLQAAPAESTPSSALTSDGTYLYYLRLSEPQLFRTGDGGESWQPLKGPVTDLGGGHGWWQSGMLAYYPNAGAQGLLISSHHDGEGDQGYQKITRYDIATDTWSWSSTVTVMGHGATILGDYLYGIWHAGGGNYGGPVIRVDLTDPSAIIDQRTELGPYLGGNDPYWMSRVAQFAVLDGYIYGIKNDWQTHPRGTGDRLYRFDPTDFNPSIWSGTAPEDYWNDLVWSARATPAVDLGELPFEPGYGAALVALPPYWSADVGADGGLFILPGQSPANHEGWGDASDLFAVYDVAGGTYWVGHLPGPTGAGGSASYHNGKVYIKRGYHSGYSSDALWLITPVAESGVWSRSRVGAPALSDTHYVEIHADTWDYAFTLWMDGVRFDPLPAGVSQDCNSDGIPDECNIASGASADCNGNLTPDECDLAAGLGYDCNENGTLDECDLLSGASADCNSDGTPDECDIAAGTTPDCNANGTPDECDIDYGGAPDCNWNWTPDECELDAGTSRDCNTDGTPDECNIDVGVSFDCNRNVTPDECELAAGTSPDCNSDGTPDACDIDAGTSFDCNANGTPDECDLAVTYSHDCNANTTPDECDIVGGTSQDCNYNITPDECDLSVGTSLDCQPNGTPDECDVWQGSSGDCNYNDTPDECDIAAGTSEDCQPNRTPDECDLGYGGGAKGLRSEDCNYNDVPDECDIAAGTSEDCQPNGTPDECDMGQQGGGPKGLRSNDCNNNDTPDECDIAAHVSADCNTDGTPDECELADETAFDCNTDGVLDECDIAAGTSPDCNSDGVPDECDLAEGTSRDCNGNGVPDECDIWQGTSPDCNTDGAPDECNLAAGTSLDCNTNGYLDECEVAAGTAPDCNGNRVPDGCDIAAGASRDCQPDGIPDECQDWAQVYFTDFQAGTGVEWSSSATDNSVPNPFTRFSGRFSNDAQTLTRPVVPGGPYTLVFDLYTIDSWDGCGPWGPDFFNVSINGALVFHHTFPGGGCYGYPYGPDVSGVNYGWAGWADAIYRNVTIPFSTAGSMVPITFWGQNLQGVGDESWGIDNVRIVGPGGCNANGIPDECDLAGGTSRDCNSNGFLDECETAAGTTADCNVNLVPDVCDLAGGTSRDCNANVTPDECESPTDCNGNGVPDFCDLYAGTSPDCNSNAIPDECDVAVGGASRDCNHNHVPDECDLDAGPSADCNANATPDECEAPADCNGNGVQDICDLYVGTSADCNENSIPDECDLAAGTTPDCNGNGTPDGCDLTTGSSRDCNENDVPDECESPADCNSNGRRDFCDIYGGTSRDCNDNAVPDECDMAEGVVPDCNINGVPDACDLTAGSSEDCNANETPDECDIEVGASTDTNSNGVPDECDPPDLAAAIVEVPALAFDGQLAQLTWSVTNVGAGPAPGPWGDAIYVSNDPVVGGDTFLRSFARVDALAGGGFYTRTEQVTVPAGFNGDYYFVVATDWLNNVNEAGAEANNKGAAVLPTTVVQTYLPDLQVTAVNASNSGFVGTNFNLSWTVKNTGPGTANGAWTDRVYFSDDDQLDPEPGGTDTLLGSFALNRSLFPNQSYVNALSFTLPQQAGTYWIFVVPDADDTIEEGDHETNNPYAYPLSVLAPDYTATVMTDTDVSPAGTPVTLTGQATHLADGSPALDVPVSLRFWVRGYRREITVTSDPATGTLSYVYHPVAAEAGAYKVYADHPAVVEDPQSPPQDQFTLLGLRAEPGTTTQQIVVGELRSFTSSLRNLGDVTVSNITAVVTGAPPELTVQVTVPASLGPLASGPINCTVQASTDLPDPTPVTVQIGADVGGPSTQLATYAINVYVSPESPYLVADLGSLSANMLREEQTIVRFTVTNAGGGMADAVTVEVPCAPNPGCSVAGDCVVNPAACEDGLWLNLATPRMVGPLAPGASTTVELALQPSANLTLGNYTGSIVVRYWFPSIELGLTLPFTFRAISEARGDLRVLVEDELTYFSSGCGDPCPSGECYHDASRPGPLLAGAAVRLLDAVDNSVVFDGVTDGCGTVLISNLPEGYYTLEARADDHGSARQTVTVVPDEETQVRAFLPNQGVSYNWTVEPTDVEDVYIITIEAEFETYVPYPVVVIEPTTVDLSGLPPGSSMQVDFTVTNYGLVAAEGVELVLNDSSSYRFDALFTTIGTLGPLESVVIPVTMTRTAGRGLDCWEAIAGGARWFIVCGVPIWFWSPVYFVYDPHECPGGGPVGGCPPEGCGGGGPAGGGPGSPVVTPPSYTSEQDCVAPPLPIIIEPPCMPWDPCCISRNAMMGAMGYAMDAVKTLTQGDGKTDPIYYYSGEFHLEEEDLRIPGRGIDFAWKRKYRSIIGPGLEKPEDPVPPQGYGWDFSYNLFIERDATQLKLHDGNTRVDTFDPQPDGTWAADQFFFTISRNADGTYVLNNADAKKLTFHTLDGGPSEGKIARIEDRNGNRLLFSYDADGRLSTITDTLDRDITVAYTADGLIESVTDFAGRQVQYDYYADGDADGSAGDLKSVTSPAVTGTPNGNDFPNGKKRTYTYSKGLAEHKLNHNLLTITDGRGNDPSDLTHDHQPYLVNVYADTQDPADRIFDRVVRQTWGGDDIKLVYVPQVPSPSNSQSVMRTIINDRVGNGVEYDFDIQNRLVRAREYTGRADPTQPTTTTANRPTGKLRPEDPAYYETRYLYNLDSMLTGIVHPNGSVTEAVYERELDPEADRTARGNLREVRHSPAAGSGGRASVVHLDYASGFGGCCGAAFVAKFTDALGNETTFDYDPQGNRTRLQSPPPGAVEEWEYNAFGQMTAHIWPDNGSGYRRRDAYVHYASGPQRGYLQQEITDAGGFALTTAYEYDAVGNVTRKSLPDDTVLVYVVNALNQVVREVVPSSGGGAVLVQRDHHYDANNNVVREDVFNFDQDGQPQSPATFTTTYEYEKLNRVTRVGRMIASGQFAVTEYEYDANRNWTRVRFPEALNGHQPDNVVRTLFDERGLIYRVVRGEGGLDQATTQYDYDANKNRVTMRAGLEDTPRLTVWAYDGWDRVTVVTDPMGNVRRYEYDAAGRRTRERVEGERVDVSGSAGNVLLYERTYAYDSAGRITRLDTAFLDAEGLAVGDGQSSQQWIYDVNGQITRVVDDNGQGRVMAYDTAGRLSTETDPKGNTVTYGYDADSRIVSVRRAEVSDLAPSGPLEAFVSTYAYDALGRLTETRDPMNYTWRYAYDSRNNRTAATDARGNTVSYGYDGLNRTTSADHEMRCFGDGSGDVLETVSTLWDWDDSSRLVGRTDDRGNTTGYAYDALNRKTAEAYADGTATLHLYDVHGNKRTTTDPNGTVVSYAYDLNNRVTGKTIVPGAGASNATTFEQYGYDGLSRVVWAEDDDSLVVRTYNSLSQAANETLNGETTESAYDGVGNLLSLRYPGGRELNYVYDALDRPKEVSEQVSEYVTRILTVYNYAGPQRVERRSYLNDATALYDYDTGGNLTHLKHRALPPWPGNEIVLDERSFSWDGNQNKTRRTDLRSGGPQQTYRYAYDSLGRLLNTTVEQIGGGDYPPAVWRPIPACNFYHPASPERKDGVVIHVAEGPADATYNTFTNCGASAHYVVDHDGTVFQFVREEDRSFHGFGLNPRSIGIEHAGYTDDPVRPEAQYAGSAALVRDIWERWNLVPPTEKARRAPPTLPPPVDVETNGTILGHIDITECYQVGSHDDPGHGWDWDHYLALVNQTDAPESFIVESRPGGKNHTSEHYEDNFDADDNATAKSTLWDLTPGIGSRLGKVGAGQYVKYVFTPSQSGYYKIYVTWPDSNNSTETLHHHVTHDDANGDEAFTEVLLNSRTSTCPCGRNNWNLLGQFHLTSGQTYDVEQTSPVPYIRADAVKWVHQGAQGTPQPAGEQVCSAARGGPPRAEKVRAAPRVACSSDPANWGWFSGLRTTTYKMDGAGSRTRVVGQPDSGLYVGSYVLDASPDPTDSRMNQYSRTPFDRRDYDANGNLVHIEITAPQPAERNLAYDYRNQMVEYAEVGGGTFFYRYDALGRRIAKVLHDAGGSTTETRFFYGGPDGNRALEEQDASGATQATYVYGRYIDEVLQMQRGAADYYYHTDDLYNVMAVTDGNGQMVERYEYGDFGQPLDPNNPIGPPPASPSTIGNPYLFNGRAYDVETGLYYYRARYLDPVAGRFTSRDPLGMWGDIPNMGNAYTYVGNNPGSKLDPLGLQTDSEKLWCLLNPCCCVTAFPTMLWFWSWYDGNPAFTGAAGNKDSYVTNAVKHCAGMCTTGSLPTCSPGQAFGLGWAHEQFPENYTTYVKEYVMDMHNNGVGVSLARFGKSPMQCVAECQAAARSNRLTWHKPWDFPEPPPAGLPTGPSPYQPVPDPYWMVGSMGGP